MTTNSAASALSGAPAAPAAAPAAPIGDAGASTTSTTTAPAGSEAWYAGIQNPEVRTWTEAKGFKDPMAVAESAYNLEKLIGFDKAGKTVVIPDENSSPETRKAFLTKMGVPDTAEGYKLPVPAGASEGFAKEAAGWFHENGVPAKAAEALTAKYAAYSEAQHAAMETAFVTKSEQEFTGLKGEWGAAFEQNLELAKRASLQFIPGTPEERNASVQALERAVGTAKLLKIMSSIGQGLGEHKVMGGEGGGGIMTPAQATQRIAELRSNQDWLAKYMVDPVGGKYNKEMSDLISLSNGGSGNG